MANRETQILRSALFVDFDNVYLGLKDRTGLEAANRFAKRPDVWLDWLLNVSAIKRRILLRYCYINPNRFGHFRHSFVAASFTVVDCPSLTNQGKNSSDIHLALDVVDALKHETKFSEFILFSADADFTPVLRRIRAYDRRTTVLTTQASAIAYRSTCDYQIPEDAFIQQALGIPQNQPVPRNGQAQVA